MLKISSSLIQEINSLSLLGRFQFSTRERKIPNLHQRLKRYGKFPQKYQLKTLIRPPNLRDDNLEFPLRIPIRYRHLYRPTKPLFIDNTKDIKWQRLSPNQILLAFENFHLLTRPQILTGLQYLSKIEGQQNHNWNEHPWINKAFDFINQKFSQTKTIDIMRRYRLMKKLNCKNEQFWKKIYKRIQQQIYEFYPSDFQYLFLTYYKKSDQYFSPEMKHKFIKLMEGRLRQFKSSSILTIFQIYLEEKRLDNYWLENVFISFFKNPIRKFTIEQIGQIFRYMMIIGHEKNDRLYENLYHRIQTHEYKSIQQVELIQDIVLQVKQIFTSHRVEPYIAFLNQEKERLKTVKQQKKLQLYEIVKQDLIFFMQKKKINQTRVVA